MVCRFFFHGTDQEQLQYVVYHHKTSRGDGNKQLGPFKVDNDWNTLALLHVQHGHTTLLQHSRGPTTPTLVSHSSMPGIRHMFIDPSTGSGYTCHGFRTWFTGLLRLKAGVCFSPHFIRNHLVTGMLLSTPQTSAHNESEFHRAVAHVMGNSLPEWTRSYCQVSMHVQGQAALDYLPEWRLEITAPIRLARQPAHAAVEQPRQVENIVTQHQECSEGVVGSAQLPRVAAEVSPVAAATDALAPTPRWWAWHWL